MELIAKQAFFDMSDYAIIRVSGINAAKFLQGQLTCNVDMIDEKHSILGASLNLKGRVEVIFRVIKNGENSYLLRLPKELLQTTLASLKKYGAFSKVEIEDITNLINLIYIHGKNCSNIISKYLNVNESVSASISANDLVVFNDNVIVTKIFGNIDRYELYFFNASEYHKFNDFVSKQENFKKINFNEYILENIKFKVPEILLNTSEKYLPHNINLVNLNAVSFKKGCYRGQEIVARMEHLSTIKKHLVVCQTFKNEVELNDPVFAMDEANQVGSIVNFAKENSGFKLLIEIEAKYLNSKLFLNKECSFPVKLEK